MFRVTKKIISTLLVVLCLTLPALLPKHAIAGETVRGNKISINFVDVEISSIIKIMSELTGKNFIFDDSVKGKVTIVAPMKLTVDESLKLFTSALELKKYTIITSGKAYKVIPLAQARQSAAKVLKPGQSRSGAIDSYIVRLVPLNYISTQEAFTLIQPLISRYGQLSIFGARNALLVVDSVSNIEKIVNIIDSVDTEPMTEKPELVYLKNTKAETVAELLRVEARRSGLGSRGAGANRDKNAGITADLRLNAIILSLPIKARENLKRFISVLDTKATQSSSRINVYYLENADAIDMSKVLSTLMTARPKSKSNTLSSRVTITPDKTTNALIIYASPTDYQGLLQVIQKLDRRPKQVFVEAMITEVTVGKALDLGTKWRLSGVSGGEPIVIGGVGSIDQSAIQQVVNGMAGLSIGGLGNYISVPVTKPDGTTFSLSAPGFAALFSLSVFKDSVNILSTPHILTSDNSEAEIIVGKNVPFLSSIERQATTTSQPLLQSIERKDVGIKLRIRPKISEGGFVKLDIFQEISALATTSVSGASDLITTKRSAKTTVVVKDQQTVVIGGLMQTQKVKSVTKVPILGDIPILGLLFKYSSVKDEKTNLLIFITPHIINNFEDLEELRSQKEIEYSKDSTIKLPEQKKKKDAKKEKKPSVTLPADSSSAGQSSKAKAQKGNSKKREAAQSKPVVLKTESTQKTTLEKKEKSAKAPLLISPVLQKKGSGSVRTEKGSGLSPTPDAAIMRIRTGEHKRFHRIVIELTKPADYTVERYSKKAVIMITGANDGGKKAAFLSTKLMSISDPRVIKSSGKNPRTATVLELSHEKGSRVKNSTLKNPYRIIVDVYRK